MRKGLSGAGLCEWKGGVRTTVKLLAAFGVQLTSFGVGSPKVQLPVRLKAASLAEEL